MKFAQVSPEFWDDETARGWNDSQQKLALYLLTCRHRNLQGFYRLSLRYASEDLGWSEPRTRKHLAQLVADGFAEYDSDAKVVLLPNTLRYYKPVTDDQVTGAVKALAKVPATPLKARFLEVARLHGADKLVARLVKGVGSDA